MDYLWIIAAVLAALCQALRYGSLKELNKHFPVLLTSYARVVFGLPILLAHAGGMLFASGAPIPPLTAKFWGLTALVAAGQFLGTMLMVRLFQIGNFAVGTMLAKADAVMTAIIGTLLFSEVISGGGWFAILVTVAGVMVVSLGRLPTGSLREGNASLAGLVLGPATRIGLLIAVVNAICFLLLREAILTVKSSAGAALDAALAGAAMSLISSVSLGAWLLATDRQGLMRLGGFLPLCCFAGLASGLGTLFWFLATALTNASYVAAVAQVQIVFAFAISHYWFRETVRPIELAGIAVILAGVLLFRAV